MPHYTRPFTENDFARAWKWKDFPAAQKIIREAFFNLTDEEENLAKNWCKVQGHDWQEIVNLIKDDAKKITYLVPEGYDIPQEDFTFYENKTFITKSTEDLFYNKRILIFSIPGAFASNLSKQQLLRFEKKYDQFISNEIDEVYCISVNDVFVMNAWAKSLGIIKTKMLSDGNGYFTRQMGMLIKKNNIGMGNHSWRYAMIVEDGQVEKLFVELGLRNNPETDPYQETTPELILEYVKSSVEPSLTKELNPSLITTSKDVIDMWSNSLVN